MSTPDRFLSDVWVEIERAVLKFPYPNASMCALTEEVGELAKALSGTMDITPTTGEVHGMNRRMSDEEIDDFAAPKVMDSRHPRFQLMARQAKDRNRLHAKIKNLQEWLQEAEQYYDKKAEDVRSSEEANFWSGRADACEDFIDDLTKVLEDK